MLWQRAKIGYCGVMYGIRLGGLNKAVQFFKFDFRSTKYKIRVLSTTALCAFCRRH